MGGKPSWSQWAQGCSTICVLLVEVQARQMDYTNGEGLPSATLGSVCWNHFSSLDASVITFFHGFVLRSHYVCY